MRSRYALSISFKSNEQPFSTICEPGREIADDADAWKWKAGMSEGLGRSYTVTLLRDGIAQPEPEGERDE